MVYLSDDELIGLQIMALINSGEMVAMNRCDVDYCDSENTQCRFRDQLNCRMDEDADPVFELTEFGDTIKLTACPMHYISPAIRQFVEEYNHFENWGGLPHLDDLGGRWQTASVYYRSYMNTIQNHITKRNMNKHK